MILKNLSFIAIVFLLLVGGNFISARAQAAPPFKVTAIKIVPFNQLTGEFEPEITPNDERPFFNDVALGLFVTVVISGKSETFLATRKIEITVLEGKTVRSKRISDASSVGADGKYYVPIFIESSFCSEVKITAKLIGQKSASTMTRKIPFTCGE